MDKFDLDKPLIRFGDDYDQPCWTIRDAVQGVQVFGGIGSGKSSSSARTLALNYLAADFGGLVLTVKTDEKKNWIEYCKLAGREDDLIIIEPNGKYHFNFLEYLSTVDAGDAITDNILESLKTVIRANAQKSSGKSDDPFWEDALDMLLFQIIDLTGLAYQKTDVQTMYDIVQSLPKSEDEEDEPIAENDDEEKEPKAFERAFKKAKEPIDSKVDTWFKKLPKRRQKLLKNDSELFEDALFEAFPTARLLKALDQFFFDTFRNLNSKTRSIIEFSFSGFLFRLLRDPVYSLFCKKKGFNVAPEDSLNGKIILLNLPVKRYRKIGRDCQILFKYIWQVQMEKRDVTLNRRPVFLFADEAQHFLHEHDAETQATARSSLIATLYITQNLPNYYASMGGSKTEEKVKSFLGTLGTKVFHANADIETNRYSSELFGDAFFEETSKSVTVAEKFSQTESLTLKVYRQVRPEEFVGLKTGGPKNDYKCDCYFHSQGVPLFNGQNFKKIDFNQLHKPFN